MAGSEEKWRIRVVASRNFGFYIGLGKNLLREHGHIELSGLGNAITNTIRAAERLVSFGYADLTSFQTDTVTVDNKKNAKAIIQLNKAAGFDKVYDDYENSRKAENLMTTK